LILIASCAGYDDYFDYRIDTVVVKKTDTVVVQDTSTVQKREEISIANLNLTVQLGSFSNQSLAKSFAEQAGQKLNYETEIRVYDDKYCIIAGSFDSVKKAEAYLNFVKSNGYPEAFIRNK
jgi:cell division septation protein DedD